MADTSPPTAPLPRWRLWLGLTFALACTLLLSRLSSFGIWDPWELNAADAGRRMLDGQGQTLGAPPLSPWLIARGFGLIAVREWAGRLPIALSGLVALGILWAWVQRCAGHRTALYALVVATTSMMVIFNSRQMLGDAPALAASGLVAFGGMGLFFGEQEPRRAALWSCVVGLGMLLSVLAQGALLAAIPPLGACVLAAALTGHLKLLPRSGSDWTRSAMAIVAVLVSARIGYDIWRDTADFSPWVGGAPSGDAPQTFDRTLEVIFHGFAPWSALLPVAVGNALSLGKPDGSLREDAPLRLTALLWAALAFAAHSLFQSRFGSASYPGSIALAVLVGLWLRDLEQEGRAQWGAALTCAFFVGLLIRDFALYPASPVDAIAVRDAEVPSVFNPKIAWAGVLGAFGAAVVVGTCAQPSLRRLALKAPYTWLRGQWRDGSWGLRIWWSIAALIVLGLLAAGVLAWTLSNALHLTSLATRVGRGLLFVPLALPLVIAAFQALMVVAGRFARFRLWPIWAAAIVVSLYAAHGFLPSLSGHFSPRDVFEVYNRFAKPGEVLAEHQVGSRAAAYYAAGEVQELDNRFALVRYLDAEERRWATFPSDELSAVDQDFRKRRAHHLVVASDPDAHVVLVTNQPVDGLDDQNPLADYVLKEAPTPDRSAHVNFEDKIELLGYNLKLPGGDSVGAGQKFEITWVFRATASNIGDYQIFLHIDGAGNRIHGDHEPVSDRFPVKLWNKGDVVIDEQTVSVPANYRPGQYEIMVGFYHGSKRLEVKSGAQDGVNRAKVGHITIR